MPDDIVLNPGAAGDSVAADQIPITTGPKFQRIKLIHGADGTNDGDVSTANPLPVDVREIGGAAVAVGGGAEAGAQRVTIANDSTGVVSVDDGGGSITVDPGAGDFDNAHSHTRNEAFKESAAIGGELDDTAHVVATEGNVSPVRITPNRGLHVHLRTDSGTQFGTPGIPIFVLNDTGIDLENTDGHTRNEAFKEAGCIGGELDDTAPVAATEGNVSPTRITAQRALHSNLRSNDGTEIGTASDPVRTDPTGTTTQPVSGTVAVTHPQLGAGTEAGAQRVTIANDSTGVVSIDDDGGSLTIDGTVTANAGTGDRNVVGNVAHDAVDSGSPVKAGAKAVSHAATPTSVANNDRTDSYANRSGVPFVIGGHPNVSNLFQNNTGAQTDQILQAVGATERFVVTGISVTADNANAADVRVLLEFDAVTDVPFFEHPGVPAGGGATWGSGAGILAIGGLGEDVILTNEVPTTGSIAVVVSGYLIVDN